MNIPSVLYKYRNLGYYDTKKKFRFHKFTANLFHKRALYFAKPSEFNDPFDCGIPITFDTSNITVEEFEKYFTPHMKKLQELSPPDRAIIFQSWRNNPDQLQKINSIQKEISDTVQNAFRVYSLSQSPLNYLLWSHYSDSHTGICIGFDTKRLQEELIQLLNLDHQFVFKVKYSSKIPFTNITFNYLHQNGIALQALYVKSKVWEYENEYRIILDTQNLKSPIITLPPDCFQEFYLGWKIPTVVRENTINTLKRKFPNARLFQIIPSITEFQLLKQEID